MGFIKKLISVLSNKKYRHNPAPPNLTVEQSAALCIGLINSEQTMYYCDSIETGADKGDISDNLTTYYGITDEETAIDTLDWLNERGHHVFYDAIKSLVAGNAASIDASTLTEEEKSQTYEYIQKLNAAISDLKNKGYLYKTSDVAALSILAWDMGRLVLVTRCCCELGYISENTAWKYMEEALKKCQAVYHDWRAFAQGYIVGRAMWSGPGVMLNGLMQITNELLEDVESPWKKYMLR